MVIEICEAQVHLFREIPYIEDDSTTEEFSTVMLGTNNDAPIMTSCSLV